MRFHVGPVPEEPDVQPEKPWSPIREPSPGLFQIVAIPVAVLVAFVLARIWWSLPISDIRVVIVSPREAVAALVVGLAVVGLHELLHALIMPGGWRSPKVILGIWPQRLMFYAHYSGVMSRDRFLAIMVAPFLLLSLGPILLIWGIATVDSISSWALTVAFAISLFNGAASCGDLLGALLVSIQVPRGALVRNVGWRTYWRPRQREEAISYASQ
ncbi:MAG: DUF3267 domain-containing protein [Ardenticatenia bacterium]|nr:DUF3267 domain-containing protein [Ardenticatenia bacterium]